MFPFEFADATPEEAMRLANNHFLIYGLQFDYDEKEFQSRARIKPVEIKEVTREQLLDRKHHFLTKNGGIYCIIHENEETVYVGLADRFHRRFTTGLGQHTEPCDDCKNHWGHFVNPTTGARNAGMPEGKCRFFILEVLPHKGNSIKQAEIDWYYLFRANGWSDNLAKNDKKITNTIGMLGAKGHDSKPIFSLRLSDGEMFYSPSSIEAQEKFPELVGAIRQILTGDQSSARDFTHRWLNAEELEVLHSNPDLNPIESISDDHTVSWLDSKKREIHVSEANKLSKLIWKSGRMSDADIQVLERRKHKNRRKNIPESDYQGVFHHIDGKWCYHAKTDKKKPGEKKPVEETRYGFDTDHEAAIAREVSIIKNSWQELNAPNFDWNP